MSPNWTQACYDRYFVFFFFLPKKLGLVQIWIELYSVPKGSESKSTLGRPSFRWAKPSKLWSSPLIISTHWISNVPPVPLCPLDFFQVYNLQFPPWYFSLQVSQFKIRNFDRCFWLSFLLAQATLSLSFTNLNHRPHLFTFGTFFLSLKGSITRPKPTTKL